MVKPEDPLITLESDKATMDVPAPQGGTVTEVRVKLGDRVSEGSVILTLEAEGAAVAAKEKVRRKARLRPPGEGQPNYGSTSGVYDEIEVKVPDIGDFKNVPVIEVHVKAGDTIKPEDPLVTLESDKATMDVPAPEGGTVAEVRVKVGDRVTEGSLILTLAEEPRRSSASPRRGHAAQLPATRHPAAGTTAAHLRRARTGRRADVEADIVVLGAGPGGYTAAFVPPTSARRSVLVERWPMLGGVCLNVGCIPSKALLHAARVVEETREMAAHGLAFADPRIEVDKLRAWKEGVVKKLVGGLGGLARQRKVTVVTGVGRFVSPHELEVDGDAGTLVAFEHAIIAAGSEPPKLPFIPHDDPRVIDSTGALELDGVPARLLVIGGGIIGLEMATVYHALGSKVTVVELMDQIIPGADRDLVTPLMKRIEKRYEKIYLKSKVTKVEAPRRASPYVRGRRERSRRRSTRSSSRSAAGPTARRSAPRTPASRSRARLHSRRQADAHQRAPHLRHRRRHRPADARAQGNPRGQGRS